MLEKDRRWRKFYDGWAPRYDWSMRLFALLRGFRDSTERRRLISRLELRPGSRVLEVSIGTGANVPYLSEDIGPGGRLVGLDISMGMLEQCRKRVCSIGASVDLVEGEAAYLPFPENSFDAVLHFGAINEFGDKKQAIDEMIRVAKPGARIVISDEGLPPDQRRSLRAKLLVRIYPLFNHQPPLELIPPEACDFHLSWYRGNSCYILDFVKS